MKWEPKRAVNTRPMKTLEAETKSTKIMVEYHTLQRWEDVKEWDEFGRMAPKDFVENMRQPLLIDGRRVYDPLKFHRSMLL